MAISFLETHLLVLSRREMHPKVLQLLQSPDACQLVLNSCVLGQCC